MMPTTTLPRPGPWRLAVAELRGRVVVACAEASASGETDGLLDLLWLSRRARWSWLVLVAALTVGNLLAAPEPASKLAPRGAPLVATEGSGSLEPWAGWWRSAPLCPTWIDLGPAARWPVGAAE